MNFELYVHIQTPYLYSVLCATCCNGDTVLRPNTLPWLHCSCAASLGARLEYCALHLFLPGWFTGCPYACSWFLDSLRTCIRCSSFTAVGPTPLGSLYLCALDPWGFMPAWTLCPLRDAIWTICYWPVFSTDPRWRCPRLLWFVFVRISRPTFVFPPCSRNTGIQPDWIWNVCMWRKDLKWFE